jgi:hypothetical protein
VILIYITYTSRSPSNSINQKLRKIHIMIIKSQNLDTSEKKLTNLLISSNLNNYGMHFNEFINLELRDSKIHSTLASDNVICVSHTTVFSSSASSQYVHSTKEKCYRYYRANCSGQNHIIA